MAASDNQPSIKKIGIEHIKPGMFIHDLDRGWIDHPFLRNQFSVKNAAIIGKLHECGIREVYIDTRRGIDVDSTLAGQPPASPGPLDADPRGEQSQALRPVALQDELPRARKLLGEATQIVNKLFAEVRLGRQIEMERIEPMVEDMVDSILRNPDALLPLARLKDHDSYTFQHSVSVCTLMISFARSLNWDRPTIREVAIGALLHDVGKAKVPDEILNKPARLSEAELVKMKSHVVQSIILLQNSPGISQIAFEVAANHHERYDGTGYPNGHKGDEIPLHGQMCAIVDVYDAITSDRSYHKGMPPTQALGRLLEWSKHQFNPDLVQTYIKTVGIYPTGALVRLQSGRLGVVLEQNPEQSMKPVVRVIYSSKSRHYLLPEVVDLSLPYCQDAIAGHESFDAWGIDPGRWQTC